MTKFAKAVWFLTAILFSECSCESKDNIEENKQEDDGKRRVIITFADRMTEGVGSLSQFALQGTTIHHNFDELRTVVATMSEESIKMLQKESNIAAIEEDFPLYPDQDSIGHRSLQELTPYGVTMVQAPEAWAAGHNGTGIKVCIIDSGIDADHEDLIDVPKTGFSFTSEAWNIDTCDHGTHVAGTIAARNNNELGVVGVAPAVELIIMDVFEGSIFGSCAGTSTSTVVAAAQKCQEEGADVINMSLGGGSPTLFAREAFAAIRNQGVLVIASAGNGGSTAINYPAGYESVVSVAAIDENKNRAWFSQRNTDVELAAPGVDVLSTTNGNRYEVKDGTSMAAPHATAVAALAWSSLPSSTFREVLQALQQSAEDLGTTGRDTSYGYGLVQALDAINILTTGTAAPTVSPAPTVGLPANDLCVNAETLQIGTSREGSTILAGYDDVGFCGTSNTAAGVWFKVVGNGRGLQVDTCSYLTNYDSKLSLYEGTCDNLVCVDGNDNSCGLRSAVDWQSENGVEYLILVHGSWSFQGSFEIAVNAAAANDLCDDAVSLKVGVPMQGTTIAAGFDDVGYCQTSNTVGGVWYKVMGNGLSLQANTCSGNTTIDTKISVFGGDCEDLLCIGGNDNAWGECGSQSAVTWQSESGVEYWILVHGRYSSSQGPFEIVVLAAAENDVCNCAETLQMDTPVTGTTIAAGYDDVGYYCGTSNTAGGVWYKISGNGFTLQANTCSGTTYNSKISVYEGQCEDLLCIGGNDNAWGECGYQSLVEWQSEYGVEYFILVHGYLRYQGKFDVVVMSIPTNAPTISAIPSIAPTYAPTFASPKNDLCSDAEFLPIGVTSEGNTVAAGSDYVGYCGAARNTVGGVWYKVIGNGARLEASTCSRVTYRSRIAVFSGDCGSLVCVNGDDRGCSSYYSWGRKVTWQSEPGIEYLIRVHGSSWSSRGSFEIVVNSGPLNDRCVDAEPLHVGTPIQGTTVLAGFDDADYCDTSNTVGGVWYSVIGNNTSLQANTCGSGTLFNTKISVYEGHCGDLLCVGGNDNAYGECGRQSAVTWQAEAGTEYFILVHGYYQHGTFELIVIAASTNDLCVNAETLQIGTATEGTTVAAGFDDVGYCGTSNTAGGVWYRIIGNGASLQANTCNNTSYDSKISVFRGSCDDDLICVGGNDNWCESQSAVTWQSEAGIEYLLLVHGQYSRQGTFEIVVITGAANDRCEDAETLQLDTPVAGTTIAAGYDNVGYCGTSNTAGGVWYKVVGVNASLQANTCDNTFYDSKISIFEGGNCSNLVCVGGNSDWCGDQSSLNWRSEHGMEYLILVHGYYQDQGTFELVATYSNAPSNDFCEDAEALEIGTPKAGTTMDAGYDNVGYCGTGNTASGVWYKVVGNGAQLEASTCGAATDYYSRISVFKGDCENPICVSGYNRYCSYYYSYGRKVSWQSEPGIEYLIRVHGSGASARGSFEIVVNSIGPMNDHCASAETLQFNTATEGTTIDAGFDDVGYCGTSNTAAGVWYTVVGNGGDLRADTCSGATYDTKISVFKGECQEELDCVGGNDDACGLRSAVNWQSEYGVEYLILVHGYGYGYYASGDFEIIVSTGPTSHPTIAPTNSPTRNPTVSMAPSATPPENDLCIDAETIEIGTSVEGTTVGAGYDGVGNCGTSNSAGGVWFKVVGSGARLDVNTCFNNTTYDSKLSVFQGDCGEESRVCIDGNDDFCGVQSYVSWQSETDVEYRILVHGYSQFQGSFEIIVTNVATDVPTPGPTLEPTNSPSNPPTSFPSVSLAPSMAPPENDICVNAETLQIGVERQGTTINAEYDGTGYCGTHNTAVGVWFKVTGDGTVLEVHTCSKETNYDSSVSVFQGDCNDESLTCIGGNDDWCGFQSRAHWQSEPGLEYLILVHGWGTSRGSFEIIVDTVPTDAPSSFPTVIPAPENDQCTNAKTLRIGVETQGTTTDAEYDGTGYCGTSNTAAGVWYKVTGDGTVLEVHTCSTETSYDSKVSVFEGDCDDESLTCIVGNDDWCGLQSRSQWQSDPGVEYLILVHGYGSSTGSFEIIVNRLTTNVPTHTPTRKPTTLTRKPTRVPTNTPTNKPTEEGTCPARFACAWDNNGEIKKYWVHKGRKHKCVNTKKVRKKTRKGWECGMLSHREDNKRTGVNKNIFDRQGDDDDDS